ncbi:hypothetical protein IG631_03132 [Alternaria alternata]|nr:hypothetical protein IG631_03132 [Alternaria alternata]
MAQPHKQKQKARAVLLSCCRVVVGVVLGSHWGREGTVEARSGSKQQQIPWILLKPEPRKRSCGCDQARVGSCSANNQGATVCHRCDKQKHGVPSKRPQ